jgi:hypothetical protein
LDVCLLIDGKKIDLNEFVKKILSGTLSGAVSQLSGVDRNWNEINITIKR